MSDPQLISQIIARHIDREGPLLPILHDIQAALGHIPDAALPEIAQALNLTRAELHGVVSFYHDFTSRPAPAHRLRICRAEACQAASGTANSAALLAALGTAWNGVTDDGIAVEPVYCLGLCACAPAAMLDQTPIGRASPARVAAALKEIR